MTSVPRSGGAAAADPDRTLADVVLLGRTLARTALGVANASIGVGGPLPMECSLDHACFQRFVLVLALAGACHSVDGCSGQSAVLHCRL